MIRFLIEFFPAALAPRPPEGEGAAGNNPRPPEGEGVAGNNPRPWPPGPQRGRGPPETTRGYYVDPELP